jgi:putative endonuclease
VTSGHRPGARWERRAESFLKRQGLRTLQRNFHARGGEIDLVMEDGNAVVFVEVRFRSGTGHGTGAESVTATKQRRLVLAAQYFLARYPVYRHRNCRFDVISMGIRDGRPLIDWIRAAFDAA